MSSSFGGILSPCGDWKLVMGLTLAGAALVGGSCVRYGLQKFTRKPLRSCLRSRDDESKSESESDSTKSKTSKRKRKQKQEMRMKKKKRGVKFDLERNATKAVDKWFDKRIHYQHPADEDNLTDISDFEL